jgi:TonB family protein
MASLKGIHLPGRVRAILFSSLVHCVLLLGLCCASTERIFVSPPMIIDVSILPSGYKPQALSETAGRQDSGSMTSARTKDEPLFSKPDYPKQGPRPSKKIIEKTNPHRKIIKKIKAKKVSIKGRQTMDGPADSQRHKIRDKATSEGPENTRTSASINSIHGAAAKSGPVRQTGMKMPGKEKVSYDFMSVRRHIMDNLRFPAVALRLGLTGKVRIAFTIDIDGSVRGIRLVSGSGYGILDDDVVETVRRTAPFPKPPMQMRIVLPIDYHVRR